MKIPKVYLLVFASPLANTYSQTLRSAIISNNDVTIYEESTPGLLTQNNAYGSGGCAARNGVSGWREYRVICIER
ncbi:MAG: hypothetical protein ACI9NQ_001234 [Paracoccaceae bacterium]|jgi:hypothetical protein